MNLIRQKKMVMRMLISTFVFDSGLANVKGDKAAENMMIYVGSEGTWYVKDSLNHLNTNHASLSGFHLTNLALSLCCFNVGLRLTLISVELLATTLWLGLKMVR